MMGNLIVTYPGTEPGKQYNLLKALMLLFAEFGPLSLSIDGDKIQGLGTTDCLGHVALVTELMKKLGQEKSALRSTVVAVFIASEDNTTIQGVGVDQLMKDGLLDDLKNSPLYWVDSSDKQPCIGTGGSDMRPWHLHAKGKLNKSMDLKHHQQ
ncbi:hypothetical protein Tsubulata_048230 [Turnera subulata]|uniref:Uncharacterized protein n=1 Tax=Turnera subulata TaxID=218843 RepID=A0A9Q0FLP0_9ROSI|nr:hypothetical protein Tsubulata_048230 [Turnera subulata]